MRRSGKFLAKAAIFVVLAAVLGWVIDQKFSAAMNALCIVGGILAVYPMVWIARRLLDLKPTKERAEWITTAVHALLMLFYGAAIFKALQTHADWQVWAIPVPSGLAYALVIVTGTATFVAVANLALRGLGAPFAFALSQKLATSWLYTWTRNPMVLATLSWFAAIGLWLQSVPFIAWVVFLLAPAEIEFLKVYEERELEIRFGEPYRAYKAKTAFLWPRRPKA
jgi:protein-S-isoprenylcysteine O-methyltransferase Ste14